MAYQGPIVTVCRLREAGHHITIFFLWSFPNFPPLFAAVVQYFWHLLICSSYILFHTFPDLSSDPSDLSTDPRSWLHASREGIWSAIFIKPDSNACELNSWRKSMVDDGCICCICLQFQWAKAAAICSLSIAYNGWHSSWHGITFLPQHGDWTKSHNFLIKLIKHFGMNI